MRDRTELLESLAESAFRSRFHLRGNELAYLRDRSLATVMRHARQFVLDRLAPAHPHNDGKQTPMRGHPVFLAQHATATCCRGCLAKWHFIAKERRLTDEEVDYVVSVIENWIASELESVDEAERGPANRQPTLFPID
jgi:hypothetical protein